MVYVELEQASELQRVGKEEDDPVENAHCRVGLGRNNARLYFPGILSYDSSLISRDPHMDPPLDPPIRIHEIARTPLSTKQTIKSVNAFLDDFEARRLTSQAGNGAVTVQLKKLKDALKEERKLKIDKQWWVLCYLIRRVGLNIRPDDRMAGFGRLGVRVGSYHALSWPVS